MPGQATGPFRARTVFAMIGAGVLAFAAFLVLAAYAGDFRGGLDPRPHPLAVSAIGFKGITRLVEETGGEVRLLRSLDDVQTEDLLVVALEPQSDPDALQELLQARTARPTLLILPKWVPSPKADRPGWVDKGGVLGGSAAAAPLEALGEFKVTTAPSRAETASGLDYLGGLSVPAPRLAQSIEGEGLVPMIALSDGRALLARRNSLHILAEPDLMNNQALDDPAAARGALDILGGLNATGAEGVAFDLTINGFGEKPNALKLLFEPPFLALTLSLLAAALLAGWYGACRFGPERREEREIALGKAALVDNSAGLLRMAGREHRAGAAYAAVIRDAAARASGAPAGLEGARLDAYLDRLSRDGAPRYSMLAERIAGARDRHDLVDSARALFWWKKDISK